MSWSWYRQHAKRSCGLFSLGAARAAAIFIADDGFEPAQVFRFRGRGSRARPAVSHWRHKRSRFPRAGESFGVREVLWFEGLVGIHDSAGQPRGDALIIAGTPREDVAKVRRRCDGQACSIPRDWYYIDVNSYMVRLNGRCPAWRAIDR